MSNPRRVCHSQWAIAYRSYGPPSIAKDNIIEIFSKMTFAHLSQATAKSQRVFHRSQIQNSLMSIEIHDQGKITKTTLRNYHYVLSAKTAFCWAFSISTMIRHSLNYFLAQLAKERPMRFDNEKLGEAIQYLNSLDFHKRLRIGSEAPISIVSVFYTVL